MLTAIPCTLMRGGTSKGLYFHAQDLPAQRQLRDRVLLAAMGSPDLRQIDGVGVAREITATLLVSGCAPMRTSTTCSCRWPSTRPKSATARTAATSSPASG